MERKGEGVIYRLGYKDRETEEEEVVIEKEIKG